MRDYSQMLERRATNRIRREANGERWHTLLILLVPVALGLWTGIKF